MKQELKDTILQNEMRMNRLEESTDKRIHEATGDLRLETNDSKSMIKESLSDMKEEVSKITGTISKPAELMILYHGKELSGRTIPIDGITNICLKNTGGRTCENISCKIYFSKGIYIEGSKEDSEGDYSAVTSIQFAFKLDPTETLFPFINYPWMIQEKEENIGKQLEYQVKMEFFYGVDKPSFAEFKVKGLANN
jgi:hypothetical protein